MSDNTNTPKKLSTIDQLERDLNLKQLQINRLLTITQAINDNVSAEGLYKMYNSFLSWEVGVRKMALYVSGKRKWHCASTIGLSDELAKMDISEELNRFQRLQYIEENEAHPLIREFDIVVPVLHKQHPIAYTFIGGFEEDEDMYSKVQFITTITNVIAVAIENKRLFKKQIEQERMRREMELATDMQLMLVPSKLPKSRAYEMASIYKPQMGVGGDYFDFVELDNNKVIFCIADISGKGIAAALLMANFQASFHSLVRQYKFMDELVINLNQSLFSITQGDKFLTMFLAEYDYNTRVFHYVNAGHNPPCLVMNDSLHLLEKGCTILGSFDQLPGVEVGELKLDDEAILLMYTDGLTDIQNEKDEYFDEEILRQFVNARRDLDAESLNQQLVENIEQFKGDRPYPDDFTLLTCKIFK